MTTTLETPRLRLRPLAADDAAASAALLTPEISRGVAHWPVAFTVEMTAAWIAGLDGAAAWALTVKPEDAPIGWLTVRPDPALPRRGAFGYWLGLAFQGRGYMREAAPPALAAAFALLDLDLIEAATQPDNAASAAVLRACGLKRVGEVRLSAPDDATGPGEPFDLYECARRA